MGTLFLSIDVIQDTSHEVFFERTCTYLNIPSVHETPEEYSIRLITGMINLLRWIWVTVNTKTLELQNISSEISRLVLTRRLRNVKKKPHTCLRTGETTLRIRLRKRDFTHPTQSSNSSAIGAERNIRRKHLYLAPYGKGAKSQLQSKSVVLVSCRRNKRDNIDLPLRDNMQAFYIAPITEVSEMKTVSRHLARRLHKNKFEE